MTRAMPMFHNRRVLVVGLGASGVSTIRYLAARGAELAATDSRERPAGVDDLRRAYPDLPLRLGGLAAAEPLERFDLAVVSPGVSLDEPLVGALRDAGVEIVGDVELFARHLAATAAERDGAGDVIAITGSNGKSTVTTLVGEMARAAGRRVAVGGNLGVPALDLLDDAVDLYVLELSSFQLETTASLCALGACVLNLSEDHLDRHGSMAAYAAAKARIYAHCTTALSNRAEPATAAGIPAGARHLSFALDAPAADGYGRITRGGRIWLAAPDGTALVAVDALRILGEHNQANALAALALADAAGLPRASSIEALCRFRGLPHRCQWVGEWQGVTWIDDSKGTNVGATLAALEGLPAPLVWLGGGQGKGQDFRPLAAPLGAKGRAAVLFGSDAGRLADVLRGALPVHCVDDLDHAVPLARNLAQAGDRVLLSPACASLDQFRNYVERGERFAALARATAGACP